MSAGRRVSRHLTRRKARERRDELLRAQRVVAKSEPGNLAMAQAKLGKYGVKVTDRLEVVQVRAAMHWKVVAV